MLELIWNVFWSNIFVYSIQKIFYLVDICVLPGEQELLGPRPPSVVQSNFL